MSESHPSKQKLSKQLFDLMWSLGSSHYIAMRPLILWAERLENALWKLAAIKVSTDCGIDPMRAAGQRQAFEIVNEIAAEALDVSRSSQEAPDSSTTRYIRGADETSPPQPKTHDERIAEAFHDLDDVLEDWQLEGRHGEPRYKILLTAVKALSDLGAVETTPPQACTHVFDFIPFKGIVCTKCGAVATTETTPPNHTAHHWVKQGVGTICDGCGLVRGPGESSENGS